MFYYISFLRPPPLQASAAPNEPILITPQICNDLRTEYLDGPIDIYYAWSLHAPHAGSPVITKSTKLTSWRTSTAYKEIPVPRPLLLDNTSKGSDGSSWRLILTCGSTQNDRAVELGEVDTTGNTPFVVMSMPVRFPSRRLGQGAGNKGTVKGAKQERIVRPYTLRLPLQDHAIVFDITEQTSFDLDKVCPPKTYITLRLSSFDTAHDSYRKYGIAESDSVHGLYNCFQENALRRVRRCSICANRSLARTLGIFWS